MNVLLKIYEIKSSDRNDHLRIYIISKIVAFKLSTQFKTTKNRLMVEYQVLSCHCLKRIIIRKDKRNIFLRKYLPPPSYAYGRYYLELHPKYVYCCYYCQTLFD